MYTYTYPRPALTVDGIVIACKQKILLIKRDREPFSGMWALPGGFVDMEETLENACIRELQEETGLRLEAMKQFRVFDAPARDPRHRTISVVFYAYADMEYPVSGADDAAEAAWFDLDKLPPLAFDHDVIIRSFTREFPAI